MIARMRENDMLLPINFDNIPNYQYIDESFRSLYYDPENLYSVPYTYGRLVPNIINWEGTGPCLVEALTLHVTDPDAAVPLIRQFFIDRGMLKA